MHGAVVPCENTEQVDTVRISPELPVILTNKISPTFSESVRANSVTVPVSKLRFPSKSCHTFHDNLPHDTPILGHTQEET
jgi:hypothetical protein